MDKITFEEASEILINAYALDVDGYLSLPFFPDFDGEPFMTLNFQDGGLDTDFVEDNNGEVEVLMKEPLILIMKDTAGDTHEIKPLVLMGLK